MAYNFEKYAQEAKAFIKELASRLNHPEDIKQTEIALKATLHTLRDRITVSESLDFIAQLPVFIKGIYVEGWKYQEKPERLRNLDDFAEKVKSYQSTYGENQFNWPEPTGQIIQTILQYIQESYVTEGEIDHIKAQLPKELEQIFA